MSWEERTKRVADGSASEEERREFVEALAGELGKQQREAVEADPYGRPRIKLPNYGKIYQVLRPAERERIEAHEQSEFRRRQPLAQAKGRQKTAFVQSGGSEADFEEHWREGGENATIAQLADERLEQAERDSIF